MRATISILLFGLACSGGVAAAQEPVAQRTPEDFARAIQEAPCDNGQDRDQDGLCSAPAETTRGFNLGVRSTGSAAPVRRTRPAAAQPGRPAQVTAASLSTLGDLRITFRSGSAEMTAQGKAEAKSFASALALPALSRRRFEIAGHTDASGSAQHNLTLSQARAESVRNYLVGNGVDPSRLEAKGYGSDDLALPNAPLDPRNRRVEARSLN
jgi:outer membrane protein OmpA-like peptidoglycan-associated protein